MQQELPVPEISNLNHPQKEDAIVTKRIMASAVLVVLLTGALVARLYFLQVTQHDYQVAVAEKNRVHIRLIPPERGLIYDRNHVVLADNVPSFNLTLTRERAGGDVGAVIGHLVRILQLPETERSRMEKELRRARRAFEPVTLMLDLTEKQIAQVAVNQFLLLGVEVQVQFLRQYPQGEHFAHSVGYVGRINEQEYKRLDSARYLRSQLIGKTGIERFYEDALHGQMGFEEVETNAQGRVMRVLRRHNPIAGQDIVLTLDAELQGAAEEALGARRGAVVALDPATGQVLAMVSRPSFDPNPFVKGISAPGYAALRDSEDMPLFNRVLRGLYPPGSTIKPMVVAGLDSGVITPTSQVFDRGYFELPSYKHKYRNWNRGGEGWVDMYDAIMRSNDTYFYDLAHRLGVRRLHRYLSEFGLGQKVSVDMFEEAAGLMPSPEWKRATRRQPWYPGETLILGIGQGYMQVTPLQLAQATSLIANRGIWHRPHLALAVGGQAPVDPRPMPNIVLKDAHSWDQVIQGMQMVMHHPRGVGRAAARGAQYRIAGKSGTAQVVAIKQGERYNRNTTHERHRDNALFVGFAPAEHPAIVVAVMIENGEAGARVAGPVVRKVMDAWLLDASGHLQPRFAAPQSSDKRANTLTVNAG